MKNIIYKILEKIKQNKVLVQNFSYLSFLQLFNMFLPLITLPYILTVIGKELYGLMVFAQAIIIYLVMLINFGFNIYGTKEISINREDNYKIGELTSSILIIKGLLFLFSFVILAVVLNLLKISDENQKLFYLTMYLCLYEFIFPIWYFQGVEKMKYITYVNLISRLLFTCLIFVLVSDKEDFLLIPLVNGFGALLAGIISIYILIVLEKVQFKFPTYKLLWHHFKESSIFALSNMSSNIKDNLSKVLIGVFLGNSEVAYFDIGEKILRILRIPVGLTVQTIFPRINREKDIGFVIKIIKILLLLMLILYSAIVIFTKPIVLFLGGDELLPAISVIRLLNILVFPNVISFLLMQILIPLGYKKKYIIGLLLSNLFYFIVFFLVQVLGLNGILQVAMIQVASEVVLLLYVYFTCVKLKIIGSPLSLVVKKYKNEESIGHIR